MVYMAYTMTWLQGSSDTHSSTFFLATEFWSYEDYFKTPFPNNCFLYHLSFYGTLWNKCVREWCPWRSLVNLTVVSLTLILLIICHKLWQENNFILILQSQTSLLAKPVYVYGYMYALPVGEWYASMSMILGVEFRLTHVLNKFFTTELHSQAFQFYFFFIFS